MRQVNKSRRERRFLIVPFSAVNVNAIFRCDNKWWRKKCDFDKHKVWGPMAVDVETGEDAHFLKEELVATHVDGVYTTELSNRYADFYA